MYMYNYRANLICVIEIYLMVSTSVNLSFIIASS